MTTSIPHSFHWRGLAAIVGLVILTVPSSGNCFELPDYDPWYFQSSELGYSFTIPDKAQHFYGSALLNEVSKRLPLPGIKVMGPVIALTAGFMFETWQDQKGIGFSQRDLLADAAGVAASQLSGKRLVLWLDYSTREQIIMFNFTINLGG